MPIFAGQSFGGAAPHIRQHVERSTRRAPLEAQIVTVISEHPEGHPLLESGDAILKEELSPGSDRSNPFLHMSLHQALRDRCPVSEPPGAAQGQARHPSTRCSR